MKASCSSILSSWWIVSLIHLMIHKIGTAVFGPFVTVRLRCTRFIHNPPPPLQNLSLTTPNSHITKLSCCNRALPSGSLLSSATTSHPHRLLGGHQEKSKDHDALWRCGRQPASRPASQPGTLDSLSEFFLGSVCCCREYMSRREIEVG